MDKDEVTQALTEVTLRTLKRAHKTLTQLRVRARLVRVCVCVFVQARMLSQLNHPAVIKVEDVKVCVSHTPHESPCIAPLPIALTRASFLSSVS